MGQPENKLNKRLYPLNREAVCMLAAAAQRSDYRFLECLGIEDECIPLLRTVGIHELDRLHDIPALVVEVKFNVDALTRTLRYLKRESVQEELIDRAIKLGLRQPMLRALTGISRREYDARRAALKLDPKEPGRIESLSERDEIRVLELWERLSEDSELSDLERLCLVAEQTSLSADRVWNAVMEGV